ncbi:glycosyltransferase family 9 protein [Herbaspirillum chlorophenolicum]|uniref:Glycosyltransferase family 9 protein n=1 Tax=Herbaspirillum chlorophenolicum TaxID=211589 RepID=A0ABW8F0U8_9BURK
MADQLVPAGLLEKADKILFVAHLALGDFTYMQNCFRAFAETYPHIRMHLWVDEVRRTADASKWDHLSKYSLYDWVKSCGLFDKIYDRTYSPALYKQSILQAQQEQYPIVVSFAVLRRHLYAELVRKLSPNGFVVGQKKRVRLLDIRKHLAYRKLNAHIPAYSASDLNGRHISAIYAGWFEQLFGFTIPEERRFPYVDIPQEWQQRARKDLRQAGIPEGSKLVFLNAFSKSEERSWPLERMIELALRMREREEWRDAHFIINCVPEKLVQARRLFTEGADGLHLFSADENFFQLPATLALCSLVVSVETAIMHLANAVHVPVIALMRQTSPEWIPIDAVSSRVLSVKTRKGWVTEISMDDVLVEI